MKFYFVWTTNVMSVDKKTFFDPLPPHLVHVVIEWPLKRYSAFLWLLQPGHALQFLYCRDFGLHGQTSQNTPKYIFGSNGCYEKKKPNMQICLQSSFFILSMWKTRFHRQLKSIVWLNFLKIGNCIHISE